MKKSRLLIGAGIGATGALLLLSYSLFFSKYFFQIKRFALGRKKPEQRIRIVLLTDLHFKRRLWPFHQRLLRTIRALKPDLILIAGDLIDEFGQPGPARRFLFGLGPATPKMVIPGNHDNKNKVSRQTLRKMVEQHNGRLLVNETTQVTISGKIITVTGLEDFIEREQCFRDAVKNTGREEHHFLLVHSPLQQETVLKEIPRINKERSADQQLAVQYIFAGHTHGGQVRLPGYIPVLPKGSGGYVNGWYNREKPFLYVSKGFGTSAVPLRFGARPEVTVFEYGV